MNITFRTMQYAAISLVAALAVTAVPHAAAESSTNSFAVSGSSSSRYDTENTTPLTPEERTIFNQNLLAVGNTPLQPATVAIEVRDDGNVIEHLADGTSYARPSVSAPGLQPRGVKQEIKRVVGACLGVSLGATGFWASIEKELTSWDRAAKFLVRRLGVLGAVSCAGGIIWEYL